jgi:hypothetical protein
VFQRAWRGLGSDEDATLTVESISRDLERIDTEALGAADRFWPVVLEQVEQGML